MQRRSRLLRFGAVCLTLLAAGSAHAGLLPIVNAGFEDPVLLPDQFTISAINGWSVDSAGAVGVWQPVSAFFSVPVPEGVQIGFTNGNSIAQGLSSVLQPGTYDLTFSIGRRLDGLSGDVEADIVAGGTVSSGVITGGTLLASDGLSIGDTPAGGFSLFTLSFTASDGDPALGQSLAIAIRRASGGQADFDNVQLAFTGSATAPEPVSGLLTLAGLGIIGILRRGTR